MVSLTPRRPLKLTQRVTNMAKDKSITVNLPVGGSGIEGSPSQDYTFSNARRASIFKSAHESARSSVGGMAIPSGKDAITGAQTVRTVKGGSNRKLSKNLKSDLKKNQGN